MGSEEIDYEDVFGYNDLGFQIVLPEMPETILMRNTNYFDWIGKYVESNAKYGNHSRDTANEVFEKVIRKKCQTQPDLVAKLLEQVDFLTALLMYGPELMYLIKMRSLKAFRLWCDIELARAGYITRFDLTHITRYNSITRKEIKKSDVSMSFSSNSFCGPFGEDGELVIVLLPYIAGKTLDSLQYLDFESKLRDLNLHLRLSRLQTFKVWLTVLTTDYCFDEEEDIQRALNQANSQEADKRWSDPHKKETTTYTHPNSNQVEKLRKASDMLILPECAFIRTSTAEFVYKDFRMGLQIVNRGKSINADANTATWQAVVRDREQNYRPKLQKRAVRELLQTPNQPSNVKYFEALTTLKNMVAVDHSLSAESYLKPFRHSYMMIRMNQGVPVPLAQPIWCERSSNVSFMLLAKILNPTLSRKSSKIYYQELPAIYPSLHMDAHREVSSLAANMLDDTSLGEPVTTLWKNPPRPAKLDPVNGISPQSSSTTLVPRLPKRALADGEKGENDSEVRSEKVQRTLAAAKKGPVATSGQLQRSDDMRRSAPAGPLQSQRDPAASYSGTARVKHPYLAGVRQVIEMVEKDNEKAPKDRDPDVPLLMNKIANAFDNHHSRKGNNRS
ncbi:MAG: hypothetical protein M1835_001341 [Candelina submexicana]|nr:MAG: hypothetical protein M1835_001341 [Candelina submexicana]